MSEFVSTSRGDRVAFDRYGSGAVVIFVAGAGPNRGTDPITTPTARLAAENGITTVVYDRLGRGESPVDGDISLERELAAIEALIAEVGGVGGSAVLCGHSSGCWISLAAAASGLPVSGLVLWEAPMGPSADETRDWIATFERLLDAGELEPALVEYMKDMPPEWLEGMRHSPGFPAAVAQVPSLRPDGESLVWSVSEPLPDLLQGISVPVEVIAGTQTFPEMVRSCAEISAAAREGSERRLPGANHMWEPPAMAAALVQFARERVAPGTAETTTA